MSGRRIKEKKMHHQLGIFLIVPIYSTALAAGYGVTTLLYRLTGPPPDILAHIFTGIGAIVLLMLTIGIINLVTGHVRQDKRKDFLDQLTNALYQISQGNFEILLDTNDNHMQYELVAAINDMAKNLGTLETMRQDFISNVSHEIQSPLTSIGGFAALLQKDGLSDAERKHYAAVIESESKRLSSLSENLLKLTSLDKIPLHMQEFRLDKQLETIALTLEPQWWAKNIEFEASLQKCVLSGDEELLSQVWVNLLHNAIKFTPEEGRIHIVLDFEMDKAVVEIIDTGIGITPEDQIHIFERFYKADKARTRSLGGNGLGLSLVKKIVTLHGGEVFVESGIGEGSKFIVKFPV